MKRQTVISQSRIKRAVQLRWSPMERLTSEGLVAMLNAFRVGEISGATQLWEIMVERDGELAANLDKRLAQTSRVDWEIFKTDESVEAERHAKALRYLYDNIRATSAIDPGKGGIRSLLRGMLTSHAYRYSVHELIILGEDREKHQVRLEARSTPLTFFEARRGRLAFFPTDGAQIGVPMEDGEWMVTVGHGYMRQCSVAYFAKWSSLADWLLFADRFGIPGVHGKTDAAKDSPEWEDFAEALKEFANDWVTLTNRAAEIETIEAKAGGASDLPFVGLVELADRLYAKLFRGSDLATQSREGSGAGASVQIDELDALLADDCERLNESLNEQIDGPILQYLFGEKPKAYFRLTPPKRTGQREELANLEFLLKRGGRVAKRAAMERLGWPEAVEGQAILEFQSAADSTSSGGPAGGPSASGREELAQIANAKAALDLHEIARDLSPFAARLGKIDTIRDPEIRGARLEALQAEILGMEDSIRGQEVAKTLLEDIAAKLETARADRAKAEAVQSEPAPIPSHEQSDVQALGNQAPSAPGARDRLPLGWFFSPDGRSWLPWRAQLRRIAEVFDPQRRLDELTAYFIRRWQRPGAPSTREVPLDAAVREAGPQRGAPAISNDASGGGKDSENTLPTAEDHHPQSSASSKLEDEGRPGASSSTQASPTRVLLWGSAQENDFSER